MRQHGRSRGFTLVEISIVVLVIGVLASIGLPNYLTARNNTRRKACAANLKRIEDAKEQWAMETAQPATATPTRAQLLGGGTNGYLKTWPTCSENGTYEVGDMRTRPTCSTPGHGLP